VLFDVGQPWVLALSRSEQSDVGGGPVELAVTGVSRRRFAL